MTQRERMTKQLAMYDFMLDDIILYLDTHPNCRMGLAAFNKYRRLCDAAKTEYEAMYGPVTAMAQPEDSETWLWSTTPWPWESEAMK
ncbi:MAG: spore coat protein CotJB [Eubacteriales bacterium]